MRCMKLTDNQIIELLGGTNKVARLCKVKPPAVTQWRSKGIPYDKLVLMGAMLEKESHGLMTRKDIDNWSMIWPELQ